MRQVVVPLQTLLVLAFAALLLAQVVLLPRIVAEQVEESPELADGRWLVLAAAVTGLVCVQVVIVCTSRLLVLVTKDRIFTSASVRWVDRIVWAIVAAWLLVLASFVYFLGLWGLSGFPLLLLLLVTAGAVLALLMLVMRALLLQATTLRTEMEGVI